MIELTYMKERFLQAEAVNISEGGILCRSDAAVEPLTRVYLMLHIPRGGEDYVMKAEGVVMHADKKDDSWLFGIAFDNLTGADREAIRGYLATCE
jgi:hypothetical protein